ncbi:MAG: hypothetical protein J7L21_01455, partial [Sulfurimonas sp.]|nr:hypothetical protein [Sulfurimonas sp.]
MLISVPIQTQVISTNVVESLPIYDEHATYVDKDLVQYDPRGGTDYAIYGVFNQTQPHSHHTFVYYSETAPNAVTDGKNYSKATASYQMEYEVLGEGKFDTIAIGHVIADTISIEFIDPTGKVIYSVIDRVVDNRIDDKGRHPPLPVTEIFYCPVDMPHGSTVKVTLKMPGDTVVAGTLLLGLSVDSGFTHLVFENRFHDYSPTEEDQWGNITYIEGVKVNIHNGTVDIQLKNYDYM